MTRAGSDRTPVALLLAGAFALSAGYTEYLVLAGPAPGTLLTAVPFLWGFHASGFATATLVLVDRVWAWRAAAVLTAGWIGVGIALYPLLFVPGLQSAVGWFLNDVVLGLLGLAEYLCVRRLRVA